MASRRSDLPKLGSLSLDGYDLDLDYYLTKAYDDISEAAEELPAIIEWVNMQLHSMIEQRLLTKAKVKEVEARAYFRLKGGDFESNYAGKMTDTSLDHAVSLDEEVIESRRKQAVVAGWTNRLYSLQSSLQSKLDLLRSTEATRRQVLLSGQDNVRED